MKKEKENKDCPHCLFSSGYMPFMGSGSQLCILCKGNGYVSLSVYKKYFK